MIVRTKSQKLNWSSFNWSSRLALGIAVSCMLMAIPATAAAAASGPLVATKDGVFQGVSTSTMNEFLGIRYAQAPVGDLRWKAPRRPERSAGILDATQFGNHCPQPASPFGLPSITEDCLFLNVFTPVRHSPAGRDGDRDHGRLPVMFWMHGGALVVGESDD